MDAIEHKVYNQAENKYWLITIVKLFILIFTKYILIKFQQF
jgi:hypothetical protein